MLCTIVIPLHNHAKWIGDALNSAISQTYPYKRIIIVDDGSTDDSSEVVVCHMDKMAFPAEQREPWVVKGLVDGVEVLLCKFSEAHGPAFARNWGIQSDTDCSYYAFLDSDDIYHPQKVEKSIKLIQTAPNEIGAVYSDYETFTESGRVIREFKPSFSREVLLRECIVNCDSVVTRAALEQVGGFCHELRVAEDLDLWLRISEHFMIAHIPEALVKIRVGDHSSTANVEKEIWRQCHAKVYERLRIRMQGGGVG